MSTTEAVELHGTKPVVPEVDVKAVEEAKKLADEDEATLEEISQQPKVIGVNGFVGDVPETQVTNVMTRLPGFPARVEETGELVDIVRKEAYSSGGRMKLIDHKGDEWENKGYAGNLVPWEDDTPTFNPTAESSDDDKVAARNRGSHTAKKQEKTSEAA